MTEEAKEYKWYLKYRGRKDSPMLRAAVKHLDNFPLWRDSQAHVISFDEYLELVAHDEISPPLRYWNISKDKVGIIALTHYRTYSTTWNDHIDPAFEDFQDGWQACQLEEEKAGRQRPPKADEAWLKYSVK